MKIRVIIILTNRAGCYTETLEGYVAHSAKGYFIFSYVKSKDNLNLVLFILDRYADVIYLCKWINEGSCFK